MGEAWPINGGSGDGEVTLWARIVKAHPVLWTLWSILHFLSQALPLLHFHRRQNVFHRNYRVLGSTDQSLISSRKELFCDHTSNTDESVRKLWGGVLYDLVCLGRWRTKPKSHGEKHPSLNWHPGMPQHRSMTAWGFTQASFPASPSSDPPSHSWTRLCYAQSTWWWRKTYGS